MQRVILIALAMMMMVSVGCAFTSTNRTRTEMDKVTGVTIKVENEEHGFITPRQATDKVLAEARARAIEKGLVKDSQTKRCHPLTGICDEEASGNASVIQAANGGMGMMGMPGMPGMMGGMGMYGMDAMYLLDSQEVMREQMLRMKDKSQPMPASLGQPNQQSGANPQGMSSKELEDLKERLAAAEVAQKITDDKLVVIEGDNATILEGQFKE